MTATDRKRPQWQSVLKWVGLWLLAQLIGGGVAGFFLGRESGAGSGLSALIFVSMIVYAVVARRRQQKIAAESTS